MSRSSHLSRIVLIALCGLAACGRGEKAEEAGEQAASPAAGASGGELTSFEQKNGVGPIKEEVALGPLDKAMAERGEKLFESKCSACHKMDERYVGPALGKVTERRTPAYVMNMILDPQDMYTRHPVAKQLLAEHLTQMPNLGLTPEEARELVEYLRTQADKPESK
jgi:cytochrome c